MVGALAALCYQMGVFAAQFESLAARWEGERFDLLQPDWASPRNVLLAFNTELDKAAGAKEIQLIGVSSGSRTAAGGLDFVLAGAAKEAET